jgi:hypothetical protein
MTTTPDYNDGAIHWWNSYATPEGLHPKSTVKVSYSGKIVLLLVREVAWGHVFAFQVTEQHTEPRAWWVNVYPGIGFGEAYKDKGSAARAKAHDSDAKTIRVVEQPEENT